MLFFFIWLETKRRGELLPEQSDFKLTQSDDCYADSSLDSIADLLWIPLNDDTELRRDELLRDCEELDFTFLENLLFTG